MKRYLSEDVDFCTDYIPTHVTKNGVEFRIIEVNAEQQALVQFYPNYKDWIDIEWLKRVSEIN